MRKRCSSAVVAGIRRCVHGVVCRALHGARSRRVELGIISRISESSDATLRIFLHWERRSGGRCQCCWRCGQWVWRRTLGGIRVERARRWMKLILTAGGSISINCGRSAGGFSRGAYFGWQDDGVEMGCWVGVVVEIKVQSCCGRNVPLGGASFNIDCRHHQRRRRPLQHHNRHDVSHSQVNWLAPACARSAPLCDTLPRPRIPHILNQRAYSPPAQDDHRRCARCPSQERLDPDQKGGCCRGHEACTGLQRCC